MTPKPLGSLFLTSALLAVAWPCWAAIPAASLTVSPSPAVSVLGRTLDVTAIVSAALEASGCQVGEGEEAGDAFSVKAEAAVTNDAPAICAYTLRMVGPAGEVIYAVPRTVEDAICSLPWLQAELERHAKIACELATAAVTKRALTTPARPAEPESSLDASVDQPPRSDGKLYAGSALVGGGVLVGALGAGLWAIDGESLGADRQADTSGGVLLTAIGVAAIAGGAYLLWEALK